MVWQGQRSTERRSVAGYCAEWPVNRPSAHHWQAPGKTKSADSRQLQTPLSKPDGLFEIRPAAGLRARPQQSTADQSTGVQTGYLPQRVLLKAGMPFPITLNGLCCGATRGLVKGTTTGEGVVTAWVSQQRIEINSRLEAWQTGSARAPCQAGSEQFGQAALDP